MSGTSAFLNMLANPPGADPSLPAKQIQTYNAAQDMWARQATAQAYSQAVDPTTGQFDPNKFNALVSRGPAAWNAGPTMQQAGTAIGAQANAQSTQLANVAATSKLIGQATMSVLRDGSDANVNAAFDNLEANGMSPAVVEKGRARWLAMTPEQRQDNAYREGLQHLDQMHQVVGQTTGVDTGAGVVPATITQPSPSGPGSLAVGPGIVTRTLTPGERANLMTGMVTVHMPSGRDQQMTPLQWAAASRQNPELLSLNPNGPIPVPAGPPPATGGNLNAGFGPAGGRNAPPGTPVVPAPLPPSGTAPRYGTGPEPGDVEATKLVKGAGAAQQTELAAAASASPQRQSILSDMESSLQGQDPLNTGPGTEYAKAWSGVVNRLPDNISSLIPGMTRETVAAQEGFTKMAEQLRQLQSQQIGGALTNDKFASSLASSPHTALSTLGNIGMIHVLQGNEDAITAKNQAWQDQIAAGRNAGTYQAWERAWNQSPAADPRVYWLAHMSMSERQRLLNGMSPAQKQRLISNFNAVDPLGLATPAAAAGTP